MTGPTLSECPSALIAGDSLVIEQTHADYQPPTWTLSWYLFAKSDTSLPPIIWTFSNAGSGLHRLTLTSAQTAAYPAGDYYVTGFVTDSTSRVKTIDGYITIEPDWTQVSPGQEVRSHAERVLDNLKAAMLTLSSATADTVSVEGVSYSRRNMETLQRMIDLYQARVDSERIGTDQNQGRYSRRVVVRFTRPGA